MYYNEKRKAITAKYVKTHLDDIKIRVPKGQREKLKSIASEMGMSFKDPIENDQIPTPIWCDEKWTEKFLNDVQNGMGTIMLHASLTDYTENHAILTNVVRSNFITHPEQCPLTVKPIAEHPIIEGIGKFTFPDFDEHYVMKMIPNADTTILAETVSKNGVQPAVWIHTYGKGKICCIVPANYPKSDLLTI